MVLTATQLSLRLHWWLLSVPPVSSQPLFSPFSPSSEWPQPALASGPQMKLFFLFLLSFSYLFFIILEHLFFPAILSKSYSTSKPSPNTLLSLEPISAICGQN
jgi:hypothetical protein